MNPLLPCLPRRSHPMEQFHDLIRRILSEGVRRPNRTGVDTFYVTGAMLEFDLQKDGFPAITTKKLAFKSAVGELLGFFRGYQNSEAFQSIGCPVWHQNANQTKEWLASPYRRVENDLGRIYGAQWTDWQDVRIEKDSSVALRMMTEQGYVRMGTTDHGDIILRRGINQLEEALHALILSPASRRIMVTGWRPDEFDKMALPPCHTEYHFVADPAERMLDLCFMQRSFDVGLGFNVALGGLFLSIMAKLAGYTPRRLVHFISDAHIYENHVEGMKEMISRSHYPQPELVLSAIERIEDPSMIKGAFERIESEHLSLRNYQHHPAIKLKMSA